MNTFLHNKFINNLNHKCGLYHNASILIAISGGQDSLCLMKLFTDLQNQLLIRIGILHVDHQWREDSVKNTQHILSTIISFDHESYIYQIKPIIYSENEARKIRYQILIDTAIKYNYEFIATAHTSNDRTETCLQNMIKGSNPNNLNSLIWNRKITIKKYLIRPLLNLQRAEISWFCRYYCLPIWSDNTNIFYSKTRNRLRQEMIPYIKLYFQPKIESQIGQFLDYLHIDCDYLKQNTIKLYLRIRHPYLMAINSHKLFLQHQSIQQKVIQLFLEHNTHIYCDKIMVYNIIQSLLNQKKARIFHSNFSVKSSSKWIYITSL